MTDIQDPATAYAKYLKALAQANALNKGSVFDALAAASIARVTVNFDGEGDSGQIEELSALTDDKPCALPNISVEFHAVTWDSSESAASRSPIAEAIEHLCYGYLSQEHGGWENNDGGYGDFTFDVAARTIELDFHERFSDSTHFGHTF